jgi:hypothetical protein
MACPKTLAEPPPRAGLFGSGRSPLLDIVADISDTLRDSREERARLGCGPEHLLVFAKE